MKNIFKFFVVALFIFIFSSQVLAEGTETPPQAIVVAEVNLQDAKIISQEGNVFKISFDIANGKGIQAGVRYGVKLISQTAKGQFLIDEKLYPENLSLSENSLINKELTYEAPANLSGEYFLTLYSKNDGGLSLGILTVKKIKLESLVKGIYISPESCYLTVAGETPEKKYNLVQGVDIKPMETLFLNCSAVNSLETEQQANYYFENTSQSFEYQNQNIQDLSDNQAILFKPGEQKSFSIELPKILEPQAYDTKLTFKWGENISNSINVHYVVSGVSATIRNLSLNKDYYKKGEMAVLLLTWSGRADNFPGSRTGASAESNISLKANIYNDKGSECVNEVNQAIKQNQSNPKIEIKTPVITECLNPQISVSLINDEDGRVLDQKTFYITTQTEVRQDEKIYLITIILASIIVVVLLVIKRKKNKQINIGGAIPSAMMILFALFTFAIFVPGNTEAATFIVGEENGVYANVTVGVSGGTVLSPQEMFSVSGSISLVACNNNPVDTSLKAYFLNASKSLDNGGASFRAPSTPGEYPVTFIATAGQYSRTYETKISVTGNGVCKYTAPYECLAGVSQKGADTEDSYNWSCLGIGNGTTASCTMPASPINGVCGAYKSCKKGDVVNVETTGPANNRTTTWDCTGRFGGDDTSCSYNSNQGGGNGNGQGEGNSTQSYLSVESCQIKAGDSKCDASVSWEISNPPENSETKIISITNSVSAVGHSGSKIFSLQALNDEVIKLLNNNVVLKTAAVSATCEMGTKWDTASGKCIETKTDGICGNAKDICSSGNFEDIEDGRSEKSPYPMSYKWLCTGLYGGSNSDTCEVPIPVNGVCDDMSPDPYQCVEGDVKFKMDQQYSWSWSCYGRNGGNYDECYLSKPLANNLPPSVPTISGPTILNINEIGTFNFSSTDPEEDGDIQEIRYGIDWNKDNIVDTWLPAPENNIVQFVFSGVSKSIQKFWDKESPANKPYEFRVLAQDYSQDLNKGTSGWGTWTVNVKKDVVTASLLPVSQNIFLGEAANLNWTSQNAISCMSSDFNTGNTTVGVVSVNPNTTKDYSITCTGPNGTANATAKVNVLTACPTGWTGTFPNCVGPTECPVGQTGTPPNCTTTIIGPWGVTLQAVDLKSGIVKDSISINKGDSIQLLWNSNATSCSILDPNSTTGAYLVGPVGSPSGSTSEFIPPKTTTYKVNCVKNGIPDSDTVEVKVDSTKPKFIEI